jgi:hypothetical protein
VGWGEKVRVIVELHSQREEANFQQPTAPVSFPCAKREAGWGLVPNSKNKRGTRENLQVSGGCNYLYI